MCGGLGRPTRRPGLSSRRRTGSDRDELMRLVDESDPPAPENVVF